MPGNSVQVDVDGKVRISCGGAIVVAGEEDACGCEPGPETLYYQLWDCCTETPANLAISTSVAGVIIGYGGNCYYIPPGSTEYTHDEAVANGWGLVITDYTVEQTEYGPPGCDDLPNCHKLFLSCAVFCWDTGNDEPNDGFFGPFSTTELSISGLHDLYLGPDDGTILDNKFFQFEGRWWYVGSILAICNSEYDDWYATNSGSILGTIPLSLLSKPDNLCCHLYQDGDFEDPASHFSVEVPCCLTVSGIDSFSCPEDPYCGGADPPDGDEWDGTMVMASGLEYFSVDSGGDPVCGGVAGYLPGLHCGVQAHLFWTGTCWQLDLSDGVGGYFWTGDGGTDPGDPTGTFTFVARYSLASPGCSTLSGGNPQLGSGPTTLTVTEKTV